MFYFWVLLRSESGESGENFAMDPSSHNEYKTGKQASKQNKQNKTKRRMYDSCVVRGVARACVLYSAATTTDAAGSVDESRLSSLSVRFRLIESGKTNDHANITMPIDATKKNTTRPPKPNELPESDHRAPAKNGPAVLLAEPTI